MILALEDSGNVCARRIADRCVVIARAHLVTITEVDVGKRRAFYEARNASGESRHDVIIA